MCDNSLCGGDVGSKGERSATVQTNSSELMAIAFTGPTALVATPAMTGTPQKFLK